MKKEKLTKILLLIYLLVLVWIILFKLELDFSTLSHARNINLIPFYYSNDIGSKFHLKEVIENIIIFIPLGMYLKVLSKKDKKIIIYGFSLSLVLEVLQYILAVGSSDITDIITNTLGTIIGLLLYKLLFKMFKLKTNKIINILALIGTILMVLLIGILLISNM